MLCSLPYTDTAMATSAELLDPQLQYFIVHGKQLLQLMGDTCRKPGCQSPVTVQKATTGMVVILTAQCDTGHKFVWASSPQQLLHNGTSIYTSNYFLPSSVLLSGNSFAKISLMFK